MPATNAKQFTIRLAYLWVHSFLLVDICKCSTHWKVTELGRIESVDDSPFTLLRPYDLAAFMQQMSRAERLDELKKIIASKEILTKKEPSKISMK